MALTGILIFLVCAIYPFNRLDKIEDEISYLSSDTVRINMRYIILKENVEEAEKETQMLNRRVDSLCRINALPKIEVRKFMSGIHHEEYRNYLKFLFDYEDKIVPERKELKKGEAKLAKIQRMREELMNAQADFAAKRAQIQDKIKQETKWYWINIIGMCVGSVLIYWGFRLWYQKVQRPLDIKIELENKLLRSDINKQQLENNDVKD